MQTGTVRLPLTNPVPIFLPVQPIFEERKMTRYIRWALLFGVVTTGNAAMLHSQLLDDNEVFESYLTSIPPVIDGILDLNEWAAAGPPIVVNNDVRPGSIAGDDLEPYGGADDLSYQFRSMWVAPWDVYFLVEVTDDVAMDDDHNLANRPFERDQVALFVDGDQLTGGHIRWWTEDPTGPKELYGKFGVARTNEFEGNVSLMAMDPEDVGTNGIAASGVATETGENANYFVEYHVSMLPAMENGLFDGTDAAAFGTMIPDVSAIKFQVAISDNDNQGDENGVRSHGGSAWVGQLDEQGCTEKLTLSGGTEMICGEGAWWRSDRYPNLLLSSEYVPNVGLNCDFDGDGSCSIADLDELTIAVADGVVDTASLLNLDGDAVGAITGSDQDAWLTQAGEANGLSGAYLRGDVNLDRKVDASDLNTIAINWNTDAKQWSEGNVTGAGVGADDLNAMALNWQSEVAVAASLSTVPKPSFGCWFASLLIGMGWLRRKIVTHVSN